MIMSQRVKEQKEEWSGNRSESEQLVQRQTVWRFQATKRSQKWLVRCECGQGSWRASPRGYLGLLSPPLLAPFAPSPPRPGPETGSGTGGRAE